MERSLSQTMHAFDCVNCGSTRAFGVVTDSAAPKEMRPFLTCRVHNTPSWHVYRGPASFVVSYVTAHKEDKMLDVEILPLGSTIKPSRQTVCIDEHGHQDAGLCGRCAANPFGSCDEHS